MLYYSILYSTILYHTILYYTILSHYILILKAVHEFWGLTEVDRHDLERLIQLIENPMSGDDERPKLDPAAWGLPFLSEPGGAQLRGPANDQKSIESDPDTSSESDEESKSDTEVRKVPDIEESNSDSDVCDAPSFDIGGYVICRPADGSDAKFWIGQVIADSKNGAGSRSGDVSIHWLDQTQRFTKDRRPHFRLSYTLSKATTDRRRKGARQR